MTSRRSQIVSWSALVLGLLLLGATLWFLDLSAVRLEIRKLGLALPLVLLVSGIWHIARTVAWAACFPEHRRVGFWHLARVRLAAEAFSYLTIRGVAGEPLKIVLLRREVDPRDATAAVALERLAFMVLTTVIIGVGALVAIGSLPLSRLWFRIFRAFAIGAGVLVVLAIAVLLGRGSYLERLLGGARGRVARFIVAVERQLLELARHNPKRLAVLVAMNLVCYVMMALEVWIVLRAVGVPASLTGSLAVETFSRVASFASAFIPANIGALEASSIAAVGAIGAASGGAALALARRIRGIFWAAAGLLISPRGSWERERGHRSSNKSTLLYSAAPEVADAAVFARVAGLPIAERVFRAAHTAGCGAVRLAAPGREQELTVLARRAGLAIAPPDGEEPKLRAEAGDIPRPGGGFSMMATRVRTAADLPAAEREIRAAVFKPTDHNLARFNRRISLPISVSLLRTPVTANQFSIGLLFLGLYSAWLFSLGSYVTGVAGAALSLAASILDGCDGEIARLKHQESDFGCWLETVTDYTYYIAIFVGMTVGSVRYTGLSAFYVVGGLALMGLGAAIMLLLYLRHRMTRHSPSRFAGTVKGKFKEGAGRFMLVLAKLSNVATRAQMPYGIMALAVIGALPLVVILCAIGANTYWMALAWKLRALIGEERRAALA
ncbi:MAG: lysylphosphatidylglycerol synthase domain-containing protein [Acidobacteriota bacterium]